MALFIDPEYGKRFQNIVYPPNVSVNTVPQMITAVLRFLLELHTHGPRALSVTREMLPKAIEARWELPPGAVDEALLDKALEIEMKIGRVRHALTSSRYRFPSKAFSCRA